MTFKGIRIKLMKIKLLILFLLNQATGMKRKYILADGVNDFIYHFNEYINKYETRLCGSCMLCGCNFETEDTKATLFFDLRLAPSLWELTLCERCAFNWLLMRTYPPLDDESYNQLLHHSFVQGHKKVMCSPDKPNPHCPLCPILEKLYLEEPSSPLKKAWELKKGREETRESDEERNPRTQPRPHTSRRKETTRQHPSADEIEEEINDMRSEATGITREMFSEMMGKIDDLGRKVEDRGAPAPAEEKRSFWKKFGACWRCFSSPCSTCMQTCGRKTGKFCQCCGQCLEDCCNPEE